MYNLDTLTQETNLRKVWPNEAKDFTPWLAEHLEYIGNILEMDLELVEKESKVGGYSADILAKAENSESDTAASAPAVGRRINPERWENSGS